jgi:hypothetical protein
MSLRDTEKERSAPFVTIALKYPNLNGFFTTPGES